MASLTIEQIAALAQISRSTVSRVLNNHPSVRPEVRDRVLQIMHEQGYTPQAAARSLASRRTQVLGLLIPRSASTIFADPFFGLVVHTITETAANLGYFLTLAMFTGEREQGFYDRFLRGRHFDGMIMLSSDIDDPVLPQLIRDQMPLVLIGSHPYWEDISWVEAEQRSGAKQAISHLCALGHRRIGTVTGPLLENASIERRDGYKSALLENGIAVRNDYITEGDWTREGGYAAMTRLLALPEPPTAVFVASDTMALGAIRAVTESGRVVPHDIAIVAFDDLPFAAFANPPLTTVRQPISDMSAAAVRLLIERLEQPRTSAEQLWLPTELVVRESCGAGTVARRPAVV